MPGPWVQMAVFCDAIDTSGGDPTPVTLMPGRRFEGREVVPEGEMPPQQFRCVFYLRMWADGAIGQRRYNAKFLAPSGQTIGEKEVPFEYAGIGFSAWSWTLEMDANLTGTYCMEIRDPAGDILTRAPFSVAYRTVT